MEYRIVWGNSIEEIEDEVAEEIKVRWKPLGGVAVIAAAHSSYRLFQAMTRDA